MNKVKIFFSILAIPLGAFMFVYGEYDDSPGAQLLGVVLVALGIWGLVKAYKKNR